MTERKSNFLRNDNLESLLTEINSRLEKSEEDIAAKFPSPEFPVVLVIGPPRSGTTVMMQWLANLGHFAYPSNLLSRFFGAPYVGGLIQRLIFDPKYNYKDELISSQFAPNFHSDLGKTKGPLEPNEFWYFWRRFVDIDQAEKLTANQIANMDKAGFLSGIASLQAVFKKPWAMKGILLQYDLQLLDEMFPKLLLISMDRSTDHNSLSLLKAREKYFGDRGSWFSVRPPGYEQLQHLSPAEQVVGQVEFTKQSIQRETQCIDSNRWLKVDYQDFCQSPKSTFEKIQAKLADQGYLLEDSYNGPEQFEDRNRSTSDSDEDMELIRMAMTTWNSRVKNNSVSQD